MMSTFQGGCVCGAVRYECSGEPIATFNCHCRDCQHLSGGAYAPVLYFAANAFRPQFDVHVADAQPWDSMDPAIPKFDGYPPM